MQFTYSRKIRFADTDAAGVVYFANILSICHEAYEEALLHAGIELNRFFGDEGVVIPISHARSDFLRPLQCGDTVEVEISSTRECETGFLLHYELFLCGPPRKLAARARTEHVCIDLKTRRRRPFPDNLSSWIAEAEKPSSDS